MQGSKYPPKLFLRKADLQDLNWNGAEGDVHVTNSPASYFITGTETYVKESHLAELRSTLERYRAGLEKISELKELNPEGPEEGSDPTCAHCGETTYVEDGCEWEPGEVCYYCSYELLDAAIKISREALTTPATEKGTASE